MSPAELAFVVAGLTLAGFLQGLSGFGFGLSAMALLPLVLNLSETQAIVTLVNIVVCIANAAALWRHFHWSGVTGLMLGAWIGVPLGFTVLTQLPGDQVRQWLGAALCLMVAFEGLFGHRAWRYPPWTQPIVGVASGALSGAFNIGGPPLVAYMYSQPWTKQRIVASLSVVFLSSGLIRTALLAQAHYLTPLVWQAAAWATGPMIVALLLGNRLLDRVPQRALRLAVYGVLFLLGVRYLLGGT
jgi:uncharacterized protein